MNVIISRGSMHHHTIDIHNPITFKWLRLQLAHPPHPTSWCVMNLAPEIIRLQMESKALQSKYTEDLNKPEAAFHWTFDYSR